MAFYDKSLVKHMEVHLPTRVAVSFYRYVTADALATVEAAGYFNSARARVKAGDIVEVTCAIGGAQTTVLKRFLAVPTSGNVTTTNALAA